MKRKMLITVPLTILAALAVAGTAAAHNASVAPSCRGIGWEVWNYEKEQTNSIVVTVDDVTVHQDLDFKASDTGSYLWTETAAHTWSVVVNAPGTQYDKSFSGTWQACQTAPTTTQPAVTTTTVVEVGEPPVPTTTASTVANPPVPAVTAPPNPNPVTYECVQDTFGNWIFSGTFIPCEGPRPTTTLTDVVSLTQVEPALPVTGNADTVLIGACILFAAGVVLLVVRGRRVQ